jgi:hypothetical protein
MNAKVTNSNRAALDNAYMSLENLVDRLNSLVIEPHITAGLVTKLILNA